MSFDFSGKNVLITGASRGIGKATALAFAQAGARVAIHFEKNREAAFQTLDQLPNVNHGAHVAVSADLGDASLIQQLVEAVLGEFGHLDILVNNAGIFLPHPIDTSTFEEWQLAWEKTMRVNLLGTAHLTYLVAGHMMKRRAGRIVQVSSRGAFRGEPDHPAYGASKAGLNAFGQSLAQKLAPYNIFVGTVAPGFVDTDMTHQSLHGKDGEKIRAQSPLNRVALPEEVAYVILFLASEEAAFTTGTIVDVNGASYLRS